MTNKPDLVGLAAVALNVVPVLEKHGVSGNEILRFMTKAASKAGVAWEFAPDKKRGDAQEFLDQWEGGKLPLPFGPCRAMDLYRAYVAWSKKAEVHPVSQRKFSQVVRSIANAYATNRGVVYEFGPEQPMTKNLEGFTDAVNKYRG